MGAAYSQDLRDRVLAAYDRGMPTKQIADIFQVCPAWARRVKQRRRELGETTARPQGGARRIKIDLDRLAALVKDHPDATLRELREQLREQLGIVCAESAICMALQRLKLSFKKRRSMPPSRIDPTLPSGERNGESISPPVTVAS